MSVENLISQLRDAAKFTLADTLYSQAADKLEELSTVRDEVRENIFDSLMGAYEGWVKNPDPNLSGEVALGNAIFLIFPEMRDEAKKRTAAIRARKETGE